MFTKFGRNSLPMCPSSLATVVTNKRAVCLLRTANAFVYYGMSVNSTSLGGNKYLNFALVCLVEIPGYSLAWIAMNRLGRRRTLCGSLLLCTATCVMAVFVPQGAFFTVEQASCGRARLRPILAHC